MLPISAQTVCLTHMQHLLPPKCQSAQNIPSPSDSERPGLLPEASQTVSPRRPAMQAILYQCDRKSPQAYCVMCYRERPLSSPT